MLMKSATAPVSVLVVFLHLASGLSSQALYDGLNHPDRCDLKLVCTVSKAGDFYLGDSEFMRGIKTLAALRTNFKAFQLKMAIKTGKRQI